MKIRAYAFGAFAALGLTAGAASTAQAADLGEIAAFALNICDAVNATGITISSADHCMKFSGEFEYNKYFQWSNGFDYSEGYTSLDLLIEVMGDSDFGVTRGWIDLEFCLDSENCYEVLGRQTDGIAIDEIGISIGNTTVLATGSGATIFNDDDDETLNHLLAEELGGAYGSTGGVYVSVTHDLGNGWSIAKAIECIDSCSPLAFLGVVSYDNNGITGHLSVLANSGGLDTIHTGFQAELDSFTVQGAFRWIDTGYWEANGSIKAALDMVELAGGFYIDSDPEWAVIFSVQFDAGDFTIAKAFKFWDNGQWDFEAEVSTDLSDTLALAVNFYLESGGFWDIDKTLTWTPGGGYELETEVGFDSNSVISAETTVTLEF